MTNATIFEGDQPTQQTSGNENKPEVATATEDSLLSALVGEGKKYKSMSDLAKAYVNADEFIEKLKEENHALREKATASKTIDDVLQRMQQTQRTEQDDSPVTPQGISVAEVQKLVEHTVSGMETAKTKQANLLQADKLMKERFGEKAADVFRQHASTPELQKVYMELASVDPQKFAALFGGVTNNVSSQADSGGTPSTVSTASVGNAAQTFGTKAYFDNVRRTDPKKYYSQDFQVQMDKAVRANPSLYFGKK